MLKRIISVWTVWNCTQKRYLRQVKLRCRLVEITSAGCLYSIISIGEINIIHIKFHNLVLTIFFLHLKGDKYLLYLSLICLCIGKEYKFCNLLRNSTSSSRYTLSLKLTFHQQCRRLKGRHKVYSLMLKKLPVLTGNHGIFCILWNLVKSKII